MAKDENTKAKDLWDKLGSLSVFLSSVVLGIAGLYINSTFNERESERAVETQKEQQQIAKVQTLSSFMPHLAAGKEMREAALFAIAVLGYPELAVKLNSLRNEDAATSDAIMRTAPASVASQLQEKQMRVFRMAAREEEIGWVYLGDYSSSGGSWNSRYLSFDPNARPPDLVNRIYGVRNETGAINVRRGMPSDAGEFMRVDTVLPPGSKLKVLETRQWLSTGYTWARVALSR